MHWFRRLQTTSTSNTSTHSQKLPKERARNPNKYRKWTCLDWKHAWNAWIFPEQRVSSLLKWGSCPPWARDNVRATHFQSFAYCDVLLYIVCWKAAEQQITVVKPLAVPSANLQLQPFPETKNSASKSFFSLVYGLFLSGLHYEAQCHTMPQVKPRAWTV